MDLTIIVRLVEQILNTYTPEESIARMRACSVVLREMADDLENRLKGKEPIEEETDERLATGLADALKN